MLPLIIGGLDADVVACVLAGQADEETRNLVGAVDRIERRRFAPAAIGHRDRIFAQQAGELRQVAAGHRFQKAFNKCS